MPARSPSTLSSPHVRIARALLLGGALVAWGIPRPVQADAPRIESRSPTVDIRVDGKLQKGAWRLSPAADPDIYELLLPDGQPRSVTFLTEQDSLRFLLGPGEVRDFTIRWDGQDCHTRIVGIHHRPAARFDAAYQTRHQGTLRVEIPAAYELVNVALALTPTVEKAGYMVYKRSDYYKEMSAWFLPVKNHPFVRTLDSLLTVDLNLYSSLRTDGYAFQFDAQGQLVDHPVFDRVGFESSNTLRPFLPELRDFAQTGRFLAFHQAHLALYESQIAYYRDTLDVAGMRDWLASRFPGQGGYDAQAVIFSPLAYGWQNANWFEDNGFSELQAHVNFPYPTGWTNADGQPLALSPQADAVLRGTTVFTELNHGFINPAAEAYVATRPAALARAEADHARWVAPDRGDDYYPGPSVYLEYLNWALINVLAVDWVPVQEQEAVFGIVERTMVEGRGFPRFPEFSRQLVDRYRARRPDETLLDLLPSCFAWFEEQR